jgi:hypothetical protein
MAAPTTTAWKAKSITLASAFFGGAGAGDGLGAGVMMTR